MRDIIGSRSDGGGADGVTNANVNIRRGCGTSTDSLGVLPKGTVVELLGNESNGWVFVSADLPRSVNVRTVGFGIVDTSGHDRVTGWVLGRYLDL